MVQTIVNLGEHEDRVLQVVKGKYGLKNKSDAVNLVIEKFEQEFLEPEIRPEYLEKLEKIRKEKGTSFKDMKELRRIVEED